jgi:hypothetical protein
VARPNAHARRLHAFVEASDARRRGAEAAVGESSALLRDWLYRALVVNASTLSRVEEGTTATTRLYDAAVRCAEQLDESSRASRLALEGFRAAAADFERALDASGARLFAASLEPLMRANARDARLDADALAKCEFQCTLCHAHIASGAARCVLRRRCQGALGGAFSCSQCACTRPQMCAACAIELMYHTRYGALVPARCGSCRRQFCAFDACIVGKSPPAPAQEL